MLQRLSKLETALTAVKVVLLQKLHGNGAVASYASPSLPGKYLWREVCQLKILGAIVLLQLQRWLGAEGLDNRGARITMSYVVLATKSLA